MTQAVEDGATRPIYYESRVVKLKLDPTLLERIDTIYGTADADPAVIEKNIKTKSIRDEESVAMLDIIFSSKFYELGGLGTTIYDRVCGLVRKDDNSYSSTLEKCEKTTQKEFADLSNVYHH